MNVTYDLVHIPVLPPPFEHLGREFPRAVLCLLIPVELLYFAIYFKIKGFKGLYGSLTFLSAFAFWLCPLFAPIICGPVKSLQNFGSEYLTPSLQQFNNS